MIKLMNNETYYSKHLITYIGNKRKLLCNINEIVVDIKKKLNKEFITSLDGFSGSGVVAILLKSHSSEIHVNDCENYSRVLNECYLVEPTKKQKTEIKKWIEKLNKHTENVIGNVSTHYSPKNDSNIQNHERVFYTHENGKRIDTMIEIISRAPESIKNYLLAPLIVQSSINTNTSGIFKGFHKKDGIGAFGGRNSVALSRITKPIKLLMPEWGDNTHNPKVQVHQKDTNELINELPKVDIAYFDPPYNQHPYGSNYFMLNLIAECTPNVPINPSGVSGILPWNKSEYNYAKSAKNAMVNLIENTKASFIIISYNNEGTIPMKEWLEILSNYTYSKVEIKYPTYKGSRNLSDRSTHVQEILWIIEKKTETDR